MHVQQPKCTAAQLNKANQLAQTPQACSQHPWHPAPCKHAPGSLYRYTTSPMRVTGGLSCTAARSHASSSRRLRPRRRYFSATALHWQTVREWVGGKGVGCVALGTQGYSIAAVAVLWLADAKGQAHGAVDKSARQLPSRPRTAAAAAAARTSSHVGHLAVALHGHARNSRFSQQQASTS